jgi:hypothetical protein
VHDLQAEQMIQEGVFAGQGNWIDHVMNRGDRREAIFLNDEDRGSLYQYIG